jgi:hypothetical protein
MPEEIEEGTLYISIRFRTAAHLCACGCGSRIVTPIKPAKWKFTYDGDSISLWPSVGNWQKPCRSHYVIKNNEVRWHRGWSDREIADGRAEDQAQLRQHYRQTTPAVEAAETPTNPSLMKRLRRAARGLVGRATSYFRRTN